MDNIIICIDLLSKLYKQTYIVLGIDSICSINSFDFT